MDRCYFIDKETFEIYEEHPNVFTCDPMIAEAVSTLNKLGYYTLASCEGHYEIKEYDASYSKDKMRTEIYILFKENNSFSNIPEGFQIENLEDRTCLSYPIYYYDKNGNHKDRIEFEIEKEKTCKNLTNWAKTLPKKKGDKYE